MTSSKNMLIAALILFSFAARADKAADKLQVDSACKSDASTAGCGNEQVGTGLMKCIHAYKKAHADFKVSDSCHSAMMTLHADKMTK